MKFYITETKESKEVTLRPFTYGSGYGSDCFHDLECNFPLDHDRLEGDDAYICTAAEYDALVEWWTEEVRCMNAGEEGQEQAEYTGPCADWDEMVLDAD